MLISNIYINISTKVTFYTWWSIIKGQQKKRSILIHSSFWCNIIKGLRIEKDFDVGG